MPNKRFLGLGFTFAATDKGLQKTLAGVSSELDSIRESLESINEIGPKTSATMKKAFSSRAKKAQATAVSSVGKKSRTQKRSASTGSADQRRSGDSGKKSRQGADPISDSFDAASNVTYIFSGHIKDINDELFKTGKNTKELQKSGLKFAESIRAIKAYIGDIYSAGEGFLVSLGVDIRGMIPKEFSSLMKLGGALVAGPIKMFHSFFKSNKKQSEEKRQPGGHEDQTKIQTISPFHPKNGGNQKTMMSLHSVIGHDKSKKNTIQNLLKRIAGESEEGGKDKDPKKLDSFFDKLMHIPSLVGGLLSSLLTGLFGALLFIPKKIITALLDLVNGLATPIFAAIRGFFTDIFEGLAEIMDIGLAPLIVIGAAVVGFFSGLAEKSKEIYEGFKILVNGAVFFGKSLWNFIDVMSQGNGVVGFVFKGIKGLGEALAALPMEIFNTVVSGLKAVFVDLPVMLFKLIVGGFKMMFTGWKLIGGLAGDIISSVAGTAGNTLTDAALSLNTAADNQKKAIEDQRRADSNAQTDKMNASLGFQSNDVNSQILDHLKNQTEATTNMANAIANGKNKTEVNLTLNADANKQGLQLKQREMNDAVLNGTY